MPVTLVSNDKKSDSERVQTYNIETIHITFFNPSFKLIRNLLRSSNNRSPKTTNH